MHLSDWRYERVSLGLDETILINEENKLNRPNCKTYSLRLKTGILGSIELETLPNKRQVTRRKLIGGEIRCLCLL